MNIKTVHVFPPIPIRSFDWCAFDNDGDESGPYGWGKTEDEAIEDLKEQLPGRGEPCKNCYRSFGEHPQSDGYRCPGSVGQLDKLNTWAP